MSNPAFSLIVCLPGEDPVRHDLGEGPHNLGRSPENDIQVLVSEVSVRHGRIEREGEGYRLFDNGSTNGTRLNGAPVGQDGTTLAPMDQLLLGTVVPAYFVPAAVLASTSLAELVASLEATPKAAAQPKTAPVAVATPAAPTAPGAVRPAPVRSAIPVGGSPVAPGGASTVRLDQVRSAPGVRPAAQPTTPRIPIAAPPAGGPPRPPVSAPLRPPGAPTAGAPPAGGPVAPKPIPLKRPDPASPTIPLTKLPPKPGQ